MSKRIIRYKGFEILHRHVFNWVFFSAWKKDKKVFGREIRNDNRLIDWDDPLTMGEKDFLITGKLV